MEDILAFFSDIVNKKIDTYSVVFRSRHKDGSWRILKATVQNYLDNPMIKGIAANYRDITEKKCSEDVLRDSEEKWSTIFETSIDVVYISTVDGKFLDINPAGEELFDYTRDELLELDMGRDIFNDQNDQMKFRKVIEREGFVKDYEIDFVKKDGTVINALLTANYRRDSNGDMIACNGIIRNITEWKKMQAQLVQTEKLSSLGGILNIKSYRRAETIFIEFDDNGFGIPKENINKIFDPFFTTKKVGEGTGFGLSITYGIINEHSGKMYVESEIDKGAKFTIELPIEKKVTEIDEVDMEKPKKPEGTKSVLVVEDEESLREVISEALSNEGYIVENANSGEKAVELLSKGKYNVIISDMKMPGMSGQNLYTFIQ